MSIENKKSNFFMVSSYLFRSNKKTGAILASRIYKSISHNFVTYIMKNTLNIECPIRAVLDRVGDKWSLLVLEYLEKKEGRFNALYREIDDISKQMLSSTLKKLEADGYIEKIVYEGKVLKIEYKLTNLGISFMKPLNQLISWADENREQILDSRRK